MKAQKPDRSIAGMDVLNDIRGLLSKPPVGADSTKADTWNETSLKAKIGRLQKEIGSYKELVEKQNEELNRLRSEKEELAARLEVAGTGRDRAQAGEELGREITAPEQRKAELSSALSDIEGLLQLKTKDLLRRIARIFDEAGQGDIALEFRKAGKEAQNTDTFASFVRALLDR